MQTYSVKDRESKVELESFGRPLDKAASFNDFWLSLPDYLAVRDLRELVNHIGAARGRRPIMWMMGAHPLKVGLSPIICDLIDRGYVSCISSHGAYAIHDCEIALFGRTSEEVADTLKDGRFGMVKETGDFFRRAVELSRSEKLGLGEALAESLIRERASYLNQSVIVRAYQASIPVTIHVAIGTDIVHEHPGLSGAALGDASYRDFLIFCNVVAGLGGGGVALNVGSALIMP